MCVVLALAPSARAASPTADLKRIEKQVRAILTSKHNAVTIKKKLKPVLNGYLDFDMLGKRSLARHWDRLAPEQQTEYLTVLRDLIEAAYLSRITGTTDFTVSYLAEKINGTEAVITTRVTAPGASLELGFKLTRAAGRWKAYDLVLEQVSLIRNYRSQFNRILKKKSFPILIKKMKRKLAQIKRNHVKGAAGKFGSSAQATPTRLQKLPHVARQQDHSAREGAQE